MTKHSRQPSIHQVLYELSEKQKQQNGLPSSWTESVVSSHVSQNREAGAWLGEPGKIHVMPCAIETGPTASLDELVPGDCGSSKEREVYLGREQECQGVISKFFHVGCGQACMLVSTEWMHAAKSSQVGMD